MKHKIENLGSGNCNIKLDGRFTFSDHENFKDILSLIKDVSSKKVVFDLNALNFVDSAALGMFLIAREEAGKNDTEIAIKNINNDVEKMFRISKFNELFNID